MALVFCAITPHPPLLIPNIGKDNLKLLQKTETAFSKLAGILYASMPDTVIIITPHGIQQKNSFTLNLNEEYNINFEEFGDYSTKKTIKGDVVLAHRIKEDLEAKFPLIATTIPIIDHGTSVPVFMLLSGLADTRVIPVHYSSVALEQHYEFGKHLQKRIQLENKRIAIIASGDLSHRLSKSSPAGYSPKGKKFDQKVISMISGNKLQDLLSIEPMLQRDACECGLRSIVTLAGVLDGYKSDAQIISYEHPLGVGYLVANFIF